ncbi:MAG: hypothetical protein JOZ47_12650 [Kutzneria sp.]|nr:hypothetical protein [Kutzneria sp.]
MPDRATDIQNDGVPPAARDRISRLLTAVVEALDGRRPVDQLRARLDPLGYAAIRTRASVRVTRSPSRIRSVRLCRPAARVVELGAVVDVDRRARALAARFEMADDSARCTALRLL